jgi:hypothetical protein
MFQNIGMRNTEPYISRQKEGVTTYELFRSINSGSKVRSDRQIEPTRLAHLAFDLQDVRPVVLLC